MSLQLALQFILEILQLIVLIAIYNAIYSLSPKKDEDIEELLEWKDIVDIELHRMEEELHRLQGEKEGNEKKNLFEKVRESIQKNDNSQFSNKEVKDFLGDYS